METTWVIIVILFAVIFGSLYLCIPAIIGSDSGTENVVATEPVLQKSVPVTIIPTTRPTEIPTVIPQTYNQYPQSIKYPFVLNGYHSNISFTTYGGFNTHLSKNDPPSYNDHAEFIKKLTMDTEQDQYFRLLLDNIRGLSSNRDEQVKIAISIVQNIPYNYTRAEAIDKKQNSSWQYPYQTIYLNSGVCIDKSLLLLYLLNKLGYDAVLFEFEQENHAAVGIRTNPEYAYKNTGYAFIETTRPTILTDSGGTYGNDTTRLTLISEPNIVYVTDGTATLNVTDEYFDAISYNELTGSQQKLHPLAYRQLELILWKYGLQDKMNGKPITEDPATKPLCQNGGQFCNGDCYMPCPHGTGTCTSEGVVCL